MKTQKANLSKDIDITITVRSIAGAVVAVVCRTVSA